jgi:UDP-glucose 4-epimerase
MKVLVTGGAGFIGSHLAERLLSAGEDVSIVDNLSTGTLENIQHLRDNPRCKLTIGSILDRDLMEPLVSEADLIYHLGAAVGVDYVIENVLDSLITNIRGTEIIFELANKRKTKVVMASTSEICGKKNGNKPFKEDDDRVLGPTTVKRWIYSSSKAVDEMLALAYWQEKKLPVVIVRPFNVIGPRQTGRYGMVVPRFVKQALLGRPITVYSDGLQRRCFTDVEDALDGLTALAVKESAAGQIFNLGANFETNEISIKDLAHKVKEMTESDSPISFIPYEEAYANGSYEDLSYRVPNLEKIRNLVDYDPKVTLDTTLRKIIDSSLQNPPA